MPFIPSLWHFLKNLRLYGANHTLSMADCQEPYPDGALLGVVNELLNFFKRAALRFRPVAPAVVREVIFVSCLLREGVEFHYLFESAAVLLVYEIRPRALAGAYPFGIFVYFSA